jgi:hypothetical protein
VSNFEVPILPDGSLASSVITTVWAGVLVVCFFNLRFGWVLSGLVVPGYIVPLLISNPLSAVVVLVEASITYAIFWVLSERISGPMRWSSFFGRDRFLGLILVTVAIRLLMDGWILPIAAHRLSELYGWEIDWQNNLHSFGLIVIALLANQLWKPGYIRGMAQSLVMIGLTFLIVRYGLMEFTNFRIGAVAYLYEDFASSILASPKAYIILITTCFIASRLNLLYGWDFSGILIPALLALQWYQPWKILTSVVEALIIFFLASALLSSRLFSGTTIEGGRKILLFFNISFLYKLVLGHAAAWIGVDYRISDLYGFGYLLPTLIALKAHDKGILPRVMRATVQTSLTGAVVGSAIGLGLVLLFPISDETVAAEPVGAKAALSAETAVAATVGAAWLDAAQANEPDNHIGAADSLQLALRRLDRGRIDDEAQALLRESGHLLKPLAGNRWIIRPTNGTGRAFLFAPNTRQAGCLAVRRPIETPGLAIASLGLMNLLGSRWLAIAGESPETAQARAASTWGGHLGPLDRCLDVVSSTSPRPVLTLVGESNHLDIGVLRALLPNLQVEFASFASLGGSRLALPVRSVRRVLSAMLVSDMPTSSAEPLSREELAFLRFEVLEPLLNSGAAIVPAVRPATAALGFAIAVEESEGGEVVIGLRRRAELEQSFLLRPEASGPVLQVSAEEGLQDLTGALFHELEARALLTVQDRHALEDAGGLLAIFTQAMLREAPQGTLILQVGRRPGHYTAANGSPMLLAFDRIEPAGGVGDVWLARLRRAGLSVEPIRWDPATAGLEIAPAPQLRFAQQALGARTAILWAPALEADR